MNIGPYQLDNKLILAPMAGVTDRPFRQLCKRLGAGLVVSEMVSANPKLRHSRKTQLRLDHQGETSPKSIQIAGSDPDMLAEAARYNVDLGAEIIDINMGCPAKKVCNKAAGSALLKDEKLVADILNTVVNSVSVPVTLKIRTGWDKKNRNALTIAKIAENEGIQALAIHGRTRECGYGNTVEYDTITSVVDAIKIPVIANGDITTPEEAKNILDKTGAAAVMLGRAAQGKPWIFNEINHYLTTGQKLTPLSLTEIHHILKAHIQELHKFYGEFLGPRIARKHVGWYCKLQSNELNFRRQFNKIDQADEQIIAIDNYFNEG